MDMNEYQKLAMKTAIYPRGKWTAQAQIGGNVIEDLPIGLIYASLGLGEVGEFQGKVKKIMRDHNFALNEDSKKQIRAELGDVLWYVAACAQELGSTLNEVAGESIEKLQSRKERGKIGGSGDTR